MNQRRIVDGQRHNVGSRRRDKEPPRMLCALMAFLSAVAVSVVVPPIVTWFSPEPDVFQVIVTLPKPSVSLFADSCRP